MTDQREYIMIPLTFNSKKKMQLLGEGEAEKEWREGLHGYQQAFG